MTREICVCVVLAVAVCVIGCTQNKPPEIVGVKAFPDELQPGDSASVMVTATDPENGRLKYKWTAKDGKLSSDKDSTTWWHAPDKNGSFKITVKVTDPKNAAVSGTVEIKVAKSAPVYSGSLGSGNDIPRFIKPDKSQRSGRKGSGGSTSGGAGAPKRGKRGAKGP